MGGFRQHRSPLSPGICLYLLSSLLGVFPAAGVFAANEPPPDTTAVVANEAAAAEAPTVLLSEPIPANGKIVPYEVTVNGVNEGTWLFVERDGALYGSADAFEAWRVTLEEGAESISYRRDTYYALTGVPGFELKVDTGNQSMELSFSPQAFAATRLTNREVARPVISEVLPSVFINYDFNYSMGREPKIETRQDLSALTELGFSTGFGVLTNSIISRNLTNNKALDQGREFTRLETSFIRDFPEHNLTLRLGDAYTKPSMLGRSIYYGGVSLGTNFGLTPGFISQPLPVITGLSATPSTVELYINDVLRQVSNVPTGPFAIDNFPTLSGSGNARIVVRDQLGRESIVEQSFVTNSQLLAKGLNDWSVEAGKVRNELGTSESDYGDEFISGFIRRGFRETLTIEGHSEYIPGQVNIGAGLVTALPFLALGRAAISTSNHKTIGRGQQWLLGLEYQSLHSNAVLEVQGASRNFLQLGQAINYKPTKLQLAGSWSYGSEKLGSFSLGLARIERYDEAPVTTMTASYSRRIGKQSSLSLIASKAQNKFNSTSTLTLNLVIPFGKNKTANTFVSSRGGRKDMYQTVSSNAGTDNNLTWRALGGQQLGKSRAEAGAYYFGRYGTLSSDISNTNKRTSVRLGAASSLVFTDGHLFATKRLDDSFAVAEIEGYPNVGIGIGSNMLTRTNANGVALIPRLMPYQNNSVQLDPRELPISAGVDSIEQIAVPAYRSAVKITFPVRTGRGALLRIILDDGDVAPAGAIVAIEGDTEEFYVARRGEAFVTGLQEKSTLILKWKGQQCMFEPTLPTEITEDIPRVGPLVCSGLTR